MNRPILNPIVTREFRARWRGGMSNILLLVYTSFLAVTASLFYASATFSAQDGALLRQMAQTGHDLFLTLSAMQIGAWMLLGPALTSTSIAGEREHGLLEMLQITPLSGSRICFGKLFSVSGFVLLIMFAPLPVTAICFLLGGVSPQEFNVALLLQVATAIFGLCLGLWASAWSRRASTAMMLSLGASVAWAVFTFLVYAAHMMGSTLAKHSGEPWKSFLLDGVWRTNPLLVFITEEIDTRSAGAPWFSSYFGIDWADWVFCPLVMSFFSVGLLFSATRAVRKPLDEAEVEGKNAVKSRRFGFASRNSNTLEPAAVKPRREWKWLTQFRSPNPMLEREVRRRGRLKLPGKTAGRWMRIGLALACATYALAFLYFLIDPRYRSEEFFWFASVIEVLLIACIASVQGALSLSREREAGTWEGLQLSLLQAQQIIIGKTLPNHLTCVAFCGVFLLPVIFALDGILPENVGRPHYQSLSFSMFLSVVAISLGTAWFCLCWGTMLSARFGKMWQAMSWTLGSLLFLYIAVPVLTIVVSEMAYGYASERLFIPLLGTWHPLFTAIVVSEGRYSRWSLSPLTAITLFVLVTTALGFVFLRICQRQIEKNLRAQA